MKIGEECPKCKAPVVRKHQMFAWRGVYSDGAVCEKCYALWPIEGEEMEPLKLKDSNLIVEDEMKIGMKKCSCGDRGCSTYWLTGIGNFCQGSGFDRQEAERIVYALNGDSEHLNESRLKALQYENAQLQRMNEYLMGLINSATTLTASTFVMPKELADKVKYVKISINSGNSKANTGENEK